MGRMYSINGYINATLRRSSKTLLVEGVTDKQVIHRMSAELYPLAQEGVTVDQAGMLDDPLLFGLGNKQKVMQIRSIADSMVATAPRLKQIFATLVDREWDGLSFSSTTLGNQWLPPVQEATSFITLGHSIENYLFDLSCSIDYLKYAFSEYFSAEFLAAVEGRYSGILALATAFSSVVKDSSCIGRCDGLVKTTHVRFLNGKYYLDDRITQVCESRGISTASSLVQDVNNIVDSNWASLSASNDLRWLMHGHLGNEMLWVCIAHTAMSVSVPPEVAANIAHGFKHERQRFFVDWISKAKSEKRIPLDATVGWLHLN
jgi:hypothetical protein